MISLNNENTVKVGNCKATLLSKIGDYTYTLELVYPRIIHGEFMTHRMMSRNASSSRATPIDTMVHEVLVNPYIPKVWPKNCKGMSASENITVLADINSATKEWLTARDLAVSEAKMLSLQGVHKEVVNRLLEPFQYIKVIATSSDWDHFIQLRDTPLAQPDIQDLAIAINECISGYFENGNINVGHSGEISYPYLDASLIFDSEYSYDELALISAARCARVSYLKHDSTPADPVADLELGQRLINDGHMTPFEHIIYTNDAIQDSSCYYACISNAVSYRTLLEVGIKLDDFCKDELGSTQKLFIET